MPTKVVSAVHGWTSEDYTMVPSVKEFKALQAENGQLKRELNAIKSSASLLERTLKSLQSNVTALKTTLRTLRQDIKNELSDGEWKKILDRTMQEATQRLEATINCASTVSASRISEGVAEKMGEGQLVERVPETSTRRSRVVTMKIKTTVTNSSCKKIKKK